MNKPAPWLVAVSAAIVILAVVGIGAQGISHQGGSSSTRSHEALNGSETESKPKTDRFLPRSLLRDVSSLRRAGVSEPLWVTVSLQHPVSWSAATLDSSGPVIHKLLVGSHLTAYAETARGYPIQYATPDTEDLLSAFHSFVSQHLLPKVKMARKQDTLVEPRARDLRDLIQSLPTELVITGYSVPLDEYATIRQVVDPDLRPAQREISPEPGAAPLSGGPG